MIITGTEKLRRFAIKHANSKKSITAWNTIVVNAHWKKSLDVLQDFPRAKILNAQRARFEIKSGHYRLIAEIDYEDSLVDIRFIGTHAEYDRINALTI